jgi:predicted DNA binding CopG/RHH family protein
MKRHDGYTDEPIGPLRVIKDFLPPPDQLILKEDGVKVTISLSKRSVDFFKKHAKKSRIPYQRMIRRVLDEYASAYSGRKRPG